MLVAANVMARRITAARIVPSIPIKMAFKLAQKHLHLDAGVDSADAKYETPRYTTAIPNNTHKNAGVTVIVAVMVRRVVTAPRIILAITASTTQLNLQLHI